MNATASLTSDRPRARGPAEQIQVLIVQSHQLVGDALEVLLNSQPDMTVVGKLQCGPDAARSAAAFQSDVVIIDFRSNVPSAMEVALKVRQNRSSTFVVALLRNGTENSLLSAIEGGASAVISESDGVTSALSTVREVARGVMLIHPGTIATLLRKRRWRDDPGRRLTKRESQVLDLLARGVKTHEIADLLSISYVTVRTHIRNLSVKLAVHSKLELVVKAYDLDLLGDPPDRMKSRGGRFGEDWQELAPDRRFSIEAP